MRSSLLLAGNVVVIRHSVGIWPFTFLYNGHCEGPDQRNCGEFRLLRYFINHLLLGSRCRAMKYRRIMKPLGELIKEELVQQERPITWFANKLCMDRSNVYRLFLKNSLDTDLLMRISKILHKNFFEILSQELSER